MSLSDVYENRCKNGMYKELITDILAMDHHSMTQAEYNVDFFWLTEDWALNYIYHNTDSSDFHTNIIAEMQTSGAGTIIAARGNHFLGCKGEPVGLSVFCKFLC